MLPASDTQPNRRRAPRPDNWRGVDAGLAGARQAYRSGRLEEAERMLREVLEFAPDEAKAWAWLGRILERRGEASESQACYARARQLMAPRRMPPPASVRLARLLWQQGERDAARAMLALLMLQRRDDPEVQRLAAEFAPESAR